MYSKTSQRLNKFCYQLLYNILYIFFGKLIVYYKYIFMKKNIFEKKSEFKCDRILKMLWLSIKIQLKRCGSCTQNYCVSGFTYSLNKLQNRRYWV